MIKTCLRIISNHLATIAVIVLCLYMSDAVASTARTATHTTRYYTGAGNSLWHVTEIVQDHQGMIWLSSWNGLWRFDGVKFSCFKSQAGDGCTIPSDRFRHIWILDNGNIGCQVDEQNFVFDVKRLRFLKSGMLSAGKGHGKTFEDHQGNRWIIQGNVILKQTIRRRLSDTLNMPVPTQVRGLFLDRNHRYWITTKQDATVRLYDRNNRHLGYLGRDGRLHAGPVPFLSAVYCLFQSSGGSLYLGCKPGGLLRLHEKKDGSFSIRKINGLNSENIYDIEEDRFGRLWVATLGGGIDCIVNPEDEKPSVYNADNMFRNYPAHSCRRVRDVHITSSGILLAATTEGLLTASLPDNRNLSGIVFRRHTRESGRTGSLGCNATMQIAEDRKHRIFIATESGGVDEIVSADLLSAKLTFRHYNMRNALTSDVVFSITPLDNRLLLTGGDRLMVFDPDKGSCDSFDRSFFQKDVFFSDASPICLPDGRWLLGLQNGALFIRPSDLRKSSYKPPIVITGLTFPAKDSISVVGQLDTLVLHPDERSVTIDFAALDYTDPPALEYAFRLLPEGNGTNRKWTIINHNRSVSIINLEPGTWQLQLQSSNADGLWTGNVRTLTIIVPPEFHETLLARILFWILSLSVLCGILYTVYYIRRIRRQRRETLEAYLGLLNKSDSRMPEKQNTLISPEDDALLKRVTEFVESHLSDSEISIGDMASAAATSRSGLLRKMKSLTGVTPLEFLREARIKQACRLLKETDETVAGIAWKSGFADAKYFSRCFKSSVGCSPTEYRNA